MSITQFSHRCPGLTRWLREKGHSIFREHYTLHKPVPRDIPNLPEWTKVLINVGKDGDRICSMLTFYKEVEGNTHCFYMRTNNVLVLPTEARQFPASPDHPG